MTNAASIRNRFALCCLFMIWGALKRNAHRSVNAIWYLLPSPQTVLRLERRKSGWDVVPSAIFGKQDHVPMTTNIELLRVYGNMSVQPVFSQYVSTSGDSTKPGPPLPDRATSQRDFMIAFGR